MTESPPPQSSRSATWSQTAQVVVAHCALLVFGWIVLFRFVPRAARKLADSGVAAVPYITLLMFDVSSWWKCYWYLLVPLFPCYLVGLVMLGKASVRGLRIWSRTFVVAAILLLTLSAVAVCLPIWMETW